MPRRGSVIFTNELDTVTTNQLRTLTDETKDQAGRVGNPHEAFSQTQTARRQESRCEQRLTRPLDNELENRSDKYKDD